ncbi:PSP1 domain-containing protein [Marssonina coronariae]|uniref:PSP1 domain-containing protein n=1 Tax=Diplocarpon coronariae TaxID=2795749 RepID=A0A218YRN5_9HELO|nr:PSP1 domain-containing protein [Marssonina coronariae]
MASSSLKLGTGGGKNASSNPSSITSSNPSILLEKFNVRRSTPDSEALASSDDEADRQDHHQPPAQLQRPARRASWLNDTTTPVGPQPRKSSFASSSMSPTTSHPNTPSAESSTWGAHAQGSSGVGRGHTGPTSNFPWGSGIWNNDARKEPPSRLTEVLPSPTSTVPPGGNFFNDLSSNYRDPPSNPNIPFAIPLHPTPKTYRSQSYSVGQLDPDSPAPGASSGAHQILAGRGRPLQHSGLHHRPSRPSMLSEMSKEGGLSNLKEVDGDDDESPNGSSRGVTLQQSNEAKTIEILARENALLRQQQYHSRIRPRSSTSNAYGLGGYALRETLPEESDYAIDELEELQYDMQSQATLRRRMSEYGAAGQSRVAPLYTSLENRKLENVKKAYWSSSTGFIGLSDTSQSRRHSFADIPTRQGSVGSIGEPLSAHDGMQEAASPKDFHARYQDNPSYALNDHGTLHRARRSSLYVKEHLDLVFDEALNKALNLPNHIATSYFGGIATLQKNMDAYAAPPFQTSSYPYPNSVAQFGGRAPSPHRGMYGVPQPRHSQLLYIVLFKCSRAEVFYVQEGTGLAVKPGDLVIVEADRGTDLGTVARANVDWASAKDVKEHYAEEHYKWLMMYSQGAAGNSDGTGAGLMAASNGLQGSAVGGMGPPSQHGMQETANGEIKPKIIKRLAQQHEIQALRDKEGNEAKAKRVCMQKVKEHGLHMEILDAEFQMQVPSQDWKKLTFYYFADAYINFNSLVTDLFKVYKTRIWMSAINPASFASPSLGLQAPSGIGPGAVGVTHTQSERRSQPAEQPSYTQASRGYQGAFAQSFSPTIDRGSMPSNLQTGYTYGYSSFNAAPRAPSAFAPIEQYGGFSAQAGYQGLPPRFPSPHNVTPTHENSEYGRHSSGAPTPSDGWVTPFQGLSLNSR